MKTYEAPMDGGTPPVPAAKIKKPKAKKASKPKRPKIKKPAAKKASKLKAKRPTKKAKARKPAKPSTLDRLDIRLTKAQKAKIVARAKKLRRTATSLVLEFIERMR